MNTICINLFCCINIIVNDKRHLIFGCNSFNFLCLCHHLLILAQLQKSCSIFQYIFHLIGQLSPIQPISVRNCVHHQIFRFHFSLHSFYEFATLFLTLPQFWHPAKRFHYPYCSLRPSKTYGKIPYHHSCSAPFHKQALLHIRMH